MPDTTPSTRRVDCPVCQCTLGYETPAGLRIRRADRVAVALPALLVCLKCREKTRVLPHLKREPP